jgi:hypothetical protein
VHPSLVYGKSTKGNVKVYVTKLFDSPWVAEVKGLRGGSEWVANEIQGALDQDLNVQWRKVDIPASLRRRIVVVQEATA